MHRKAMTHIRNDPVMKGLVAYAGPLKLVPNRHSPFQSLARSIVYQQLSGKAAATIFGRFCGLYRKGGFPSPQSVRRTSLEKLRSVGLSRAKAAYIHDLADRAARGLLPSLKESDGMTNDELIESLTAVKGIGRWSVEMFLIFNLAREDVLPVDDLGVRRGYQVAYGKRAMPEPKTLMKFGDRWAPYRTTATWYLWRAAEPGFKSQEN